MSQSESTPHRVVAERVKELRKKRGWSAAHLAAEMAKAGIAWDRSIVAKFENGYRASLTVEELFALAYALSVAPVHLVVPITDDSEPYQVVPGVMTDRATARAWIRGLEEPFGDPRVYASEVPASEQGPDTYGRIAHVQTAAALRDAWSAARGKRNL